MSENERIFDMEPWWRWAPRWITAIALWIIAWQIFRLYLAMQ